MNWSRLIAFSLILAAPGYAAAQCVPGQLVTQDTAGRCCWPGQAWSNSRGLCVGTPTCPPGTRPQGETCLAGVGASVGVSIDASAMGPPPPPLVAQQPVYAQPVYAQPQPVYAQPQPVYAQPQQQPVYAQPAPVYQQAPAGAVPVRFVARNDDEYTVTVTTTAGTQQCRTPCALSLMPGSAHVVVSGARDFDTDVDVPPQGGTMQVQHFRTGRLVWGIVGTASGVGLIGLGLEFMLASSICGSYDYYGRYTSSTCSSGLVIPGVAIGLTGIALAIVAPISGFGRMGRNRVELVTGDMSSRSSSLRLAGVSASPLPHGGATLGAAFTF